jgi:purine-binding chemotaxis protein CheW
MLKNLVVAPVAKNRQTSALASCACYSYSHGSLLLQGQIMAQNPTSTSGLTLSSGKDIAGHEFLAFTLGQEEYGIDILKVQEIRGYEAVTRIANAPDFIKGVINLRGIIIPVVDMRIKFNLGTPVYDQFTVVIILNIGGRIMGMVVDSVSDVTTLSPEQVKPAPEMGTAFNTNYLIGLGTIDERMLILVDIDKLMSSSEMGLIERLAG